MLLQGQRHKSYPTWWACVLGAPVGQHGKRNPQVPSKSITWFSFRLEEIPTLEQVMVKGLVGREDRRHLVVVGRMDVLIDAVARELHLRQGREGSEVLRAFGGGGHVCVSRVCTCQGQDSDLGGQPTPSPSAETLVFSEPSPPLSNKDRGLGREPEQRSRKVKDGKARHGGGRPCPSAQHPPYRRQQAGACAP